MKSPHSLPVLLFPAAALLALLVLVSGCASQQTTGSEAAATPPAGDETSRTPLAGQGSTEAGPMDSIDAVGKVVYFDFDRDDIKPEFRELIAAHAKFLRAHPQAHVKLGGHADERGTREYNLALSERRAKAVFNQLMIAGVPESQLSTAAYGEEYPAVQGHDEAAWSKNRRVEFNYQ